MGIKTNIKSILKRIKIVNELEDQYKLAQVNFVPDVQKKQLIFEASASPKVSIIIPFYNEDVYTWNCLLYLHKHLSPQIPFEIILIDDNSPENCDFSLIKGITIHRNTENLGFLKNINKGIDLAKGEYVYILNNDTEVQENFLEELFFVFDNFENVGAVGSKLINADLSLQEAGSVFLKDCHITQIVGGKKRYYPEVNYISKVDYCSGCSLLFKKMDDHGNLNLFDEQFAPAYFEETDFCFNLKYLQKKEIYYTPFSEVLHYNGVSYNSQKNTDESKIKRKQELFAANLEKFKNKWSKEIQAIKATNTDERILELYGNKSITFFCYIIPEYDKDSGSNRLKEIILSFVELGFHVTLIKKNNYIDNEYNRYYQKLGINVFYEHKKWGSIEKFLKKRKFNSSIAWFYGPKTFIENYKYAQKYLPDAKLVYDMVDIHHLRFERALELDPRNRKLKRKYRQYKKKEILSSKIADFIITISDFEENFMKTISDPNKIITLSNIHYPKIDKAKAWPFEDRNDIVFIGSIHEPNIDALYYLYNDIMPMVWEELPDLKVNVLGNVNEKINDIHHPNFIFHGYVNSVEPFFISNKLMVAPLRFGAGVKGKIGQAFEYYLPIVTSSIGAEGMKIKNNENALVEDTNEAFAKSIINLYTDPKLWQKLQDNSEVSLFPFSKENLKATLSKLL